MIACYWLAKEGRTCARCRWRRADDPQVRFIPLRMIAAKTDRRSVVHPDLGVCWVWLDRSTTHNGYKELRYPGNSTTRAHRWVWEHLVGPIADGLVLHHRCGNRACVRPAHLEPCLPGENTLRSGTEAARLASLTHCMRGHPFDEANTYRPKRGGRQCRECRRLRDRGLV